MMLFQGVLLSALTLQRSGAAILLHEAGATYSVALAVLLGELAKQLTSLAIGVQQHISEEAHRGKLPSVFSHEQTRRSRVTEIKQAIHWFLEQSKSQNKMATCIPAALYVIQNNLFLYASSRLLPGIFQGIWQLRLISIALCSRLILKKRICKVQWLALSVVLIGVLTLQQGQEMTSHAISFSKAKEVATGNILAICALLFAGAISGLAAVLLEKTYTDSQNNLWVSNFQLSMFSLPPAILLLLWECLFKSESVWDPFTSFLSTFWPWVAVAIQSFLGIFVALSTKYAGSIAGGLSGVMSIALTRLIQLARGTETSFVRERNFFGGFLLVVAGVGIYVRYSYADVNVKYKALRTEPRQSGELVWNRNEASEKDMEDAQGSIALPATPIDDELPPLVEKTH